MKSFGELGIGDAFTFVTLPAHVAAHETSETIFKKGSLHYCFPDIQPYKEQNTYSLKLDTPVNPQETVS